MKYTETRNYGFNKIIKEYCGFPKYLPLPCHCEHGWTVLPNALKSDLATDKPLMLVFSKRRKQVWKKQSKIPAEIVGAPFVLYKNFHLIKKKNSAKGTVVFPSHSTFDLKIQFFNIEDYCQELSKLPKAFHPITICLFWLDYISPKSSIYRKYGFRTVTAGSKITNSLSFVKNFYHILSQHKYATGNEVGTAPLYALDFGLPFFLTGKTPKMHNLKGRDVNIPEWSTIMDYKIGRDATKLFSTGPIKKVTPKQKKFVEDELGVKQNLSGKELNKLLWKYYNKNHYSFHDIFRYWLNSFVVVMLFNMPWTGLAFKIREKMQPFYIKSTLNKMKDK